MRLLHHLRRAVRAVRRLVDPRAQGIRRSGQWRALERRHLAAHPECAACGKRGRGNQVHHEEPVHKNRARELDPTNLITLCKRHHLVFGYADCWAGCNPHVRGDAKTHRQRVESRSAD
jgi:5-methylcytosine-specific restriction endonuclease McrA